MKQLLYICHAFSRDPAESALAIRRECRSAVSSSCVPVAPQIYLPQFLDEATERDIAMACCLKLVSLCDELHVYGEPTEGMQLEIAEAERRGIPIVCKDRP